MVVHLTCNEKVASSNLVGGLTNPKGCVIINKCEINSAVECLPSKQNVRSSNLLFRSREINSVVRVSALHAESPQFESVISH